MFAFVLNVHFQDCLEDDLRGQCRFQGAHLNVLKMYFIEVGTLKFYIEC